MNIREALPEELDIVENIVRTTIIGIYPHYYPEGAVRFFLEHHNRENIGNDIADKTVYLCTDSTGNAAGTVTIKKNEVCRLFVLPEFQGRGYGGELLRFAEKKISRHYSEIVLDASLPAKAIYMKKGYTETAYHIIETDNGDFLCYDLMKKIL